MSIRNRLSSASVASLLVAALAVGCNKSDKKPDAPAPAGDPKAAAPHDHHGEGPHGGTILEWAGGKYHLEFTVDHDKQEAMVYVLDGDAKNASPIAANSIKLEIDEPVTSVELMAMPLDGEPAGSSSRFVGKHENIGIVREYPGSIGGTVDGKPMAGDFKELPH